MKVLLLLGAAIALSGCALGTTIDQHGVETKRYFGYVAVQRPPSSERVFARDATAIGISFERGLGIGYMRDRHWVIPLDCRVVFVVSNQEQVKQVLATIGDDLRDACAVLDSSN